MLAGLHSVAMRQTAKLESVLLVEGVLATLVQIRTCCAGERGRVKATWPKHDMGSNRDVTGGEAV